MRAIATDGHGQRAIESEGALLWHVGGPQLMAEQLDRIVEASTRPNIRLGVITHHTPVSFTAGHGFHVYDRQAVQIGTRTATALTSDQRDVEAYESLFAGLERVAAFGDDARSILTEISERYRAFAEPLARFDQRGHLRYMGRPE